MTKKKNRSPNHEDLFSSKTTKKTKLNNSTNGLKKASINLNINSVSDTDRITSILMMNLKKSKSLRTHLLDMNNRGWKLQKKF